MSAADTAEEHPDCRPNTRTVPQLARDLAFTIISSYLILSIIHITLDRESGLGPFLIKYELLFGVVVVFSIAVTAVMELYARMVHWVCPARRPALATTSQKILDSFKLERDLESADENDVEAQAGVKLMEI